MLDDDGKRAAREADLLRRQAIAARHYGGALRELVAESAEGSLVGTSRPPESAPAERLSGWRLKQQQKLEARRKRLL